MEIHHAQICTKKVFASQHVMFNENGKIDASIFPPSEGKHNSTHKQWEGLLQDHKIHDLDDLTLHNIESSGSDSDSDSGLDSDPTYQTALISPPITFITEPSESISTRTQWAPHHTSSCIPHHPALVPIQSIHPTVPHTTDPISESVKLVQMLMLT